MEDSARTQRQAWAEFDDLCAGPNVSFRNEPDGLDAVLRILSNRDEVTPKRWTDDYLVAFGQAAGLTLVTFDKALAARAPGALLLTA